VDEKNTASRSDLCALMVRAVVQWIQFGQVIE
jgi:hypothetical protein